MSAAAAAHHPDQIDAGFDLGPHGVAQRVDAVALVADEKEVAAGDRQHAPSTEDRRPDEQAIADGIAQLQRQVVAAAAVAHRGHAGAEQHRGVVRRAAEHLAVALAPQRPKGIRRAVEHQVRVGVDETGQQGDVAHVERRRPRGRLEVRGAADGRDAAAAHEHGAAFDHARLANGEHAVGDDAEVHRPSPEETAC